MNLERYETYVLNFKKEHDKWQNKMESSSSINAILEAAKAELSYFREYIYNFFSESGSADGIRRMYESVGEREYNWKEIKTCDVNRTGNLYENYNWGMKKYLDEILAVETVSDDKSAIDTIKKAKENDSIFVSSILGGYNNESSMVNICEAVKNIEFLIDFIPMMENFSQSLDTLINTSEPRVSNDTVLESVKLYTESVSNYCYRMISWIVSDYHTIQEEISPEHKDESSTFTLF